jgi:hypothetical protein
LPARKQGAPSAALDPAEFQHNDRIASLNRRGDPDQVKVGTKICYQWTVNLWYSGEVSPRSCCQAVASPPPPERGMHIECGLQVSCYSGCTHWWVVKWEDHTRNKVPPPSLPSVPRPSFARRAARTKQRSDLSLPRLLRDRRCDRSSSPRPTASTGGFSPTKRMSSSRSG